MAFDPVEYVRIEGEFLSLAGGDLWERVEAAAWEYVERQKRLSSVKTKERRATVFGARYHREYAREHRKRHKQRVRAVRCCRVCRRMYPVSAQQILDGTGKFCTPSCFGKWNRARNAPRPTRLVTIDGRTRPLPEWAKRFGITVGMVYKRMREGMSAVEALTQPKVKRGGNQRWTTIDGETLSIAQWARRCAVQPNTLITRMRRHGETVEQALAHFGFGNKRGAAA